MVETNKNAIAQKISEVEIIDIPQECQWPFKNPHFWPLESRHFWSRKVVN